MAALSSSDISTLIGKIKKFPYLSPDDIETVMKEAGGNGID